MEPVSRVKIALSLSPKGLAAIALRRNGHQPTEPGARLHTPAEAPKAGVKHQ